VENKSWDINSLKPFSIAEKEESFVNFNKVTRLLYSLVATYGVNTNEKKVNIT
jgi:hypothetical protein